MKIAFVRPWSYCNIANCYCGNRRCYFPFDRFASNIEQFSFTIRKASVSFRLSRMHFEAADGAATFTEQPILRASARESDGEEKLKKKKNQENSSRLVYAIGTACSRVRRVLTRLSCALARMECGESCDACVHMPIALRACVHECSLER